jgi:hypothetical protein
MPQFFNSQRLVFSLKAFIVMVAAASTTWANPITISTGNVAPAAAFPETAGLLLLGGGLVATAGVARRRLNKQRKNDMHSD